LKPNHYNGRVDCIKTIRELTLEHQNDAFTDYCRYQSFKYLWRLGKKDDVLKELLKARQFLTFAIDALENENEQ